MSYSTRTRYTSRREKLNRGIRNFRLILIFAVLTALVLIVKNRYSIWAYIKTYFMD